MNQRRIRPHRCLIYIYSGRSTNGHNGTLPLPKAYIFLSIFFSLFRYFFGHGCFNIYVLRVSPEYKFGANMKKREMVAALIVAYGVHSKSSMCMLITLPVFFFLSSALSYDVRVEHISMWHLTECGKLSRFILFAIVGCMGFVCEHLSAPRSQFPPWVTIKKTHTQWTGSHCYMIFAFSFVPLSTAYSHQYFPVRSTENKRHTACQSSRPTAIALNESSVAHHSAISAYRMQTSMGDLFTCVVCYCNTRPASPIQKVISSSLWCWRRCCCRRHICIS